jgi:spore germination cell wall hydrolase CwlJ-like protein
MKSGIRAAHRRADGALLVATVLMIIGALSALAYKQYTDETMRVALPGERAVAVTQSPVELAAAKLVAEQTCLAEAMYYEARGEGEEGQKAVAEVVLQRTHDLAFPKTICGVVHEGAQLRTGCQFTFMCDGSLKRMKNPIAWRRIRQLASEIIAGAVRLADETDHATYYHAAEILPPWTAEMTRTAQIGNHIFYKRDTTRGS